MTKPKSLPIQLAFCLAISLLFTPLVHAQTDSTNQLNAPPHAWMKALSWLEGTWEGEGQVPDGGKYTSVITYVVDLNGNVMRHDYQAFQNGALVWHDQGMLAYNADLEKIIGITIGIDGSYGEGQGEISNHDSVYTISGRTAGVTEYKEWRTIVTRIDETTAKTRFEYRKDDAYVFFSEEVMRKKK